MKDILLNKDLDIEISEGDLLLDKATLQSQNLLIISQKREWKEYPNRGVGIEDFLLDESIGGLQNEIKKELEKDNLTNENIEFKNESS